MSAISPRPPVLPVLRGQPVLKHRVQGDHDHVRHTILIHGLLTLWLSYDIDIDYNGSYDYLQDLANIDTAKNFSADFQPWI